MKLRSLFLILFIAFCNISQAKIFYVDAFAATAPNARWNAAYTTLQAALAALPAPASGDTIYIAKGTYTATSMVSFAMPSGVKVFGGFADVDTLFANRNPTNYLTTLKGNGKSVLTYSSSAATTVLDGFTITRGTGTGTSGTASGGGISLVSASPSFNNLIITGNKAANGGGINMSGASSPAITNLTVSNDTATANGGGINISGSSSPTLTNITISNDIAAANGGGIYEEGSGSPTFTNIAFLNNSTSTVNPLYGGGGGMYITGTGSPVLTNAVFQSNLAVSSSGAGLMQYKSGSPATGNVTINKAVFYGNKAEVGGGIYSLNGATLKVTNTLFAYDSSTDSNFYYGAWGAGGLSNNTTVLTVTNSTFYNNYGTGNANADLRFLNSTSSNTINNSVFYSTGETASTPFAGTYNGTPPTINYSYIPTTTGSSSTFTNGTSNVASLTDPFFNNMDPMSLSGLVGLDGKWMTADDGLHLIKTSSAVDQGNSGSVPAGVMTDLAGQTRIQGTAVDMGAYEGAYPPLPVTLVGFSGSLQNGIVQLQWQTDIEQGFSRFDIEKSTDGQTYHAIETILAKGDNSSYYSSFTQTENKAYYRLKMIDMDGNFKFSIVLPLSQQVADEWQLYPNPAKDHIYLHALKSCTVNIYDAAGRLMKRQQLQQGLNVIDIINLNPGVYFCVADGRTLPFIKQ